MSATQTSIEREQHPLGAALEDPAAGASSATHAGTSASTPASAADQDDTRRGANMTQPSATSHHATRDAQHSVAAAGRLR